MAALTPVQPLNYQNCPKCGYNNVTGAETCDGKLADGSTCGTEILVSK